MQLHIPKSLNDYLKDTGIATAVDHLLTRKSNQIPLDLNWEEVIAYHDALLMAAKVRRDYLKTLIDISKIIWQPDERWKEFPIAELEPNEQPSPEVIWNDSLYRVFELNDNRKKRLYTALAINPGEGVIAYMKLEGMEANQISLSQWMDKDEDGYRHTLEYLAVPGNTGIIDLGRLKEVTDGVLAAIAKEATSV